MYHRINSRKYGTHTFWMSCSGTVYLEDSEYSKEVIGKPICHGGEFTGQPVKATPETFKLACSSWWRDRREYLNDFGDWEREHGAEYA